MISLLTAGFCASQSFVRTADIFKRSDSSDRLNIIQNQAIDTLLNRYILSSKKQRTMDGSQGMQGFRIQVYYSSVRNARDESSKARAEFINKFPDIISYAEYREPGWFMVRAGDYRSRTECYKDLLDVRKVFPNAYPVPAVINFPDLIKK
ncbi:MAG TPA: SPOR domain-containing protein [Bacteroidales bacterium]|nr:SPOR domain-containing protein [Bacteroidales bacterium]